MRHAYITSFLMLGTPKRGYIALRRRLDAETRWFWSAGREFELWYLTIHAFGLYFGIIGPFRWN